MRRRRRGREPVRRAATPRAGGVRRLPPARSVALVAAGGAVGAVARVAVSTWMPGGTLPWSTLVENASGTFALGWLLTVVIERLPGDRWVRPLLVTGVLGAYTTFATVGLELQRLAAGGRGGAAAAYLAATWTLCAVAAGAGIALGRWRPRRRAS